MIAIVQEQKHRKYRTHADPSSTAVLLRSYDGGNTWDPNTKTIVVAADNEAINDPAIKQLQDGTLIVDFFKWRFGGDEEVPSGHTPEGGYVESFNGEHYAWSTGTHIRQGPLTAARRGKNR